MRGLVRYQTQITAAAYACAHSASPLKFRSFDSLTVALHARASAGTSRTAEPYCSHSLIQMIVIFFFRSLI